MYGASLRGERVRGIVRGDRRTQVIAAFTNSMRCIVLFAASDAAAAMRRGNASHLLFVAVETLTDG